MGPEVWMAGVVLVMLIVYTVTGGADFGGGLWDLLAKGPRANAQRKLIATVLAPIWEANHVWLIAVIVSLFICFPPAFATITTALHIPLTLMLIGIVLRGTSFVFRSYDAQDAAHMRRWSVLFAIGSLLTPLMLGVTLGATISGTLTIDPITNLVQTDFISDWFAPFPICVGVFTVSLCAFLAAVYLTLETHDEALREDFRRRALGAAFAVGVMALVCYLVSATGAPRLHEGLGAEAWSMSFQVLTGIFAVGAIVCLWTRRFRWARACAIVQVGLIVLGMGLTNYPYVVPPDLTIAGAAAPESVIHGVLIVFGIGSVLLIPSFMYLYRVFGATRRTQRPGGDS